MHSAEAERPSEMGELLRKCEERAIDYALSAMAPRVHGGIPTPKENIALAADYACVAFMLRLNLSEEEVRGGKR